MSSVQHTIFNSKATRKPTLEAIIVLGLAIAAYFLAATHDILERAVEFTRRHEHWEFDELISVSLFMIFALAVFALRRWKEAVISNEIISQQNKQLEMALSEVEQLRGLIPICRSCDAIRFDDGYWHQVGAYVREHAETEFNYGICPDCVKKKYPSPDVEDEQHGNEGKSDS